MNVKLSVVASLTLGVIESVKMNDVLGVVVPAKVYMLFGEEFREDLCISSNMVRNVYGVLNYRDLFKGDVYVSKDSYFKEALNDSLDALVFAGKDILLNEGFSDVLELAIKTDVFHNIVARFDFSIPPNHEVEIDSDLFTVYVNNVNRFDRYSGGWIELSREAVELVVSTGNNADLKGNMIYTERYL